MVNAWSVYYIEGSVHAEGFMMVYLPKEKSTVEADAFTPPHPTRTHPLCPTP
jgi:hypothetical protein